MKKNILYILIFVMAFACITEVQAASTTSRVVVKTKGKSVRSAPSVTAKLLGALPEYSYFILVDEKMYPDANNHKKIKNSNCETDWYKIYYNGTDTGYICGENVEIVQSYTTDDVSPSTACETEMKELGFPSSYWGGLCRLKEKHPEWNFNALDTNLTWEEVIENESVCGKNKIYKTATNTAFIDNTCTKENTGNFVSVLPAGIAYYMDPRNFLSEGYIFQFQHLAYDTSYADLYPNAINDMLKDAEFYKYFIEKDVDFSSKIISSGLKLNINPIFTSARILQELGNTTKLYKLYSGTGVYKYKENDEEKTATGYYNFYNIGVSDGCVSNFGTEYCGLKHAYAKNWNSVDAGIEGGISLLANNYVAKNQYTTYLQKFNVTGTKKYVNQYQSNVGAPSTESTTSYYAYKKVGILESPFSFYIPIYSNMNATLDNSGNGPSGSSSNNSSSPSSLPISTIVTSSGYRYESDYITNVKLGTDAATLKEDLESVAGNSTIIVTDSNGNRMTDGLLGTGCKVEINNKNSTETLEIVVKGDTSGDGAINALDLLQIQKTILGTYSLSGASLKAGDPSSDGKVNALDLLQVQKNILGTYTIIQ